MAGEIGGRPKGCFLDGDPLWWVAPIKKNERTEEVILQMRWLGNGRRSSLDDIPPISWKGWKRQRLEPKIQGFLFPVSWSLILAAVGMLFLLFDQNKGYSPWVGTILVLLSPLSIVIVAYLLLESRQFGSAPEYFVTSLKDVWNLALLSLIAMSIWWAWDAKMDPSEPFWFIFLVFSILSWLWWTTRCSQCFSIQSSRWLMPVDDSKEIPLPKSWVGKVSHSKWAAGELARLPLVNGFLRLSGDRVNGVSFLVLEYISKLGCCADPWVGERQELPLKGLANFFSMEIDMTPINTQLRGVDMSFLYSLKVSWPAWAKPEEVIEPEEE
ncbi:MAG: hypothetical protein HN696_01055 [Euryarchaeota archaeon]|nr:hypothetical protein [Euryarchaeota archaeon]